MILAAGLTPAWQQILQFDAFHVGEVNRAARAQWCASGKVLNVGIALDHLGADCHTLSFLGGSPGEQIRAEFAAGGIPATWVDASRNTRVCTTILNGSEGPTTELVENAPTHDSAELDRFRDAYREAVQSAGTVVFSGSLPEGTPPEFVSDLLDLTDCRAILDIRGPELLDALSKQPLLVKPNREELARTLDTAIETDAQLLSAMRELNSLGAQWVAITHGPETLWLTSQTQTFRLTPPQREVVNPIGCGDCLAAGIAVALDQGSEIPDAVWFGAAAAADNLGQLLPARLNRARIASSVLDIVIEEM